MIKLGVLISGTGSNLIAIQEAIERGELDASIELVISSRPNAKGLTRAHEHGLKTMALSKELYDLGAQAADEIIASQMMEAGVDFIVMAGYMRKVTQPILQGFPNRVINIHPALLPSFQGAHAIEEAWLKGVKVAGVSIHFANEVYDQGPIIAQRAFDVPEGVTLEELESLIHEVEHKLYPEVLQKLAEDRVRIMPDNTVRILD
ncbi:MAG: phosphoribosylglycinamide formyltransferase [Coriobacteriia bacterium]|nr:phosphoribosylglycinamide formyltransferase [Coriobacteriia bacterium]